MNDKGNKKADDAIKIADISVAGLPPEFIIENPRKFIRDMRKSFLKKARVAKGMSIDETAVKCEISVEEMQRIESGNVTEQHMMTLHKLSEIFELDYLKLLQLFKLVENKPSNQFGMAAYHDQKLGEV